ncbi:DUF2783 domain-containing protein [Limnohabitans sp. Rim8]|jgi:hypothetical protein|uniref:DUF2783 domain-containing protein n=1 Tax=Limnohabitans sp. Rim8 TaxID=1100718 RepID=UPI0026255B5C|nr:DUF2783 domain-containing protein [Limnohabitans sp. Rim8]
MLSPTLSLTGLETVYDALATAIDQVDASQRELFLVKLALLNAHALADDQVFQTHLDAARQDLS